MSHTVQKQQQRKIARKNNLEMTAWRKENERDEELDQNQNFKQKAKKGGGE